MDVTAMLDEAPNDAAKNYNDADDKVHKSIPISVHNDQVVCRFLGVGSDCANLRDSNGKCSHPFIQSTDSTGHC